MAERIPGAGRRDAMLSSFGPLSLLLLIGLWAVGIILGYALITWGLRFGLAFPSGNPSLADTLYYSGSIFFTLGLGDILPVSNLTRLLAIFEAGTGFGFLALVISYIPVLYQAFSRREVAINQLDARAGSPPTAVELLRRHGPDALEALERLLADWERWAADLLESHLSYPLLGYYRSQHDNQSWLAALTTVLDASAAVLCLIDGGPRFTAGLTFAMGRHAAVDLSQAFGRTPVPFEERMAPEILEELRDALAAAGFALRPSDEATESLLGMRELYEPYVSSLAPFLRMPLPAWVPAHEAVDDWQATQWRSPQRRDS
jgi:hypothetical protein